MGYPRKVVVNEDKVEMFHCWSRCVRRAYLCGKDPVTGDSYEHRREWITNRLSDLADNFGVEVVSFAVMSNHYHLVLKTRPDLSATWTPIEVALRWRAVYPKRVKRDGTLVDVELEAVELAKDVDKIEIIRKRLSSLSWFHRALNEHIARRANYEDKCTGCFWEGRFKCQKILEPSGIVACSVYVDLNPIRAGAALLPEDSDFTSVKQRVEQRMPIEMKKSGIQTKVPLLSISEAFGGLLSDREYFELVDCTGRLVLEGKKSIPEKMVPLIERLGFLKDNWMESSTKITKLFCSFIGGSGALKTQRNELGMAWIKGTRSAQRVFSE